MKLLFSPTPETAATAGYIEANGKVWVQGAAAAANRLGQPGAGERYLQAVADLIGGQVRHYEKMAPEVVDSRGKGSDLAILLRHAGEWRSTIATLRRNLALFQAE